ncbi:amino-acid N-acetyltransferase [Ranunculus cassubicifolius]
MLVAFEAGGLLRALVLFLMYPFVCLVSRDRGIKMMVMVCFFGLKKDGLRVGRAVLPKYFMEDVGLEGFQLLMRGGRKVGVSDFPEVMVESFLKEHLQVDVVIGRELKVFRGYYVGLMEDHKHSLYNSDQILSSSGTDVIGISSFCKPLHHLFSLCNELYRVSDEEKRSSWQYLPKEKYPKPLVFHDGRLAVRPTPLATLALLVWLPFTIPLVIFRGIVFLLLPGRISNPIVAFTGVTLRISRHSSSNTTCRESSSKKGVLYVCNHRTLFDPLYLSAVIDRPLTAVTYSLSRLSELLAPIENVRLTRDREVDAKKMDELLSKGDMVICPEGTTCREPYLLRFSPLFAEMGDEIVPVAINSYVTMFHGTTASGLKCLDPLFYLMNPFPTYHVQLLKPVSGTSRCQDNDSGDARVKIANHIQQEIGKALGFECTKLTRRDKYLALAGNEGVVKASS